MVAGSRSHYWLSRRRGRLLPTARIAELTVFCLCCSYLPPVVAAQKCKRPPVIFNFGDSNSDTGGLSAGLGLVFGAPHGRSFFHRPTGRVCDGRLIIDFLCEAVGTSYLRPYLDSVDLSGSNFTNGANFAIAGAAVIPPSKPFNLLIQVLQFLHFQSASLDLAQRRQGQLVNRAGFDTALYTVDIGQNDLSDAFTSNISYDDIVGTKIPAMLEEIKNNMLNLYAHGARRFWVHNTGPLGCLPERLVLSPRKGTPGEIDSVGCLAAPNAAAKEFNAGLRKMCDQLRAHLADATVVYVDVFAVKYDVIANAGTKYGFDTPPLMACCGYGGQPYNFDRNVKCLEKGFQACAEGIKYVSWDGIHYSEAANSIFAAKIISGNYSNPPLSFQAFCNV